ncbi:hypothetical protein K7T73_12580 [Bacillus badius]|uniref:hypothetical protein n=1 Tax=Bacillus badius TaxID=1455 RepID=UPI001CBB571A|nr:hypothetical protein [Bacillus badius]UAT29436.1 hypothetical protein K7T73_12580 [Bacillus badius]
MKIIDLKRLMNKYGDIKISEIIQREQGRRVYECPKCKGTGEENKVEYGIQGYTPDRHYKVKCDVCYGFGYTEKQLKTKVKTEIIGYE